MGDTRPADPPPFRADGYLPVGLHRCTESQAVFRFGSGSARRRWLTVRVHRWVELARLTRARRLLIDGSYVTAKADPDDVDAVVLLSTDFARQVEDGSGPAMEFEEMLLTRHPAEIFAAEDEADWLDWIEFFSQTRESDGRSKGLVEIIL